MVGAFFQCLHLIETDFVFAEGEAIAVERCSRGEGVDASDDEEQPDDCECCADDFLDQEIDG